MLPLCSLIVALPVAALLAAAHDPTGLPTTVTLGGVVLLFLGLFASDKWGSHSERDRLRAELAAERAASAEMNRAIREELIPAVLENTRILGDTNRLLADTAKALRGRPK